MTNEEHKIRVIKDCYEDLTFLFKILSPKTFYLESPDFHYELDEVLLDNSKRQVLREAPRGTSKTTKIISKIIHHGVFEKCDKLVVIQSKTRSESLNRLTTIKNTFEYSQVFRDLFDIEGMCTSANAEVWREDKIIVKIRNPFDNQIYRLTIKAIGTGQQVRGALEDSTRITLYCHAKGSLVWEDGRLVPIENTSWIHLPERIDKTKQIKVYGNPIEEIVTYEHRVWAREKLRWYDKKRNMHYKLSGPKWVEAKDLRNTDFWIGEPIDYLDSEIQPIEIWKNKLAFGLGYYRTEIPEYFKDKEFWWAYGLWLGDGHRTKTMVAWSCADKYPEIKERLYNFIKKYGSPQRVQKIGCEQILWCNTKLSEWLQKQREGNSTKIPPVWVRQLPVEYLRLIIRGLIDSDGWINKSKERPCVKITSINLEGLLIIQKILAKLNIPSWVRAGSKERIEKFPNGYTGISKPKFDIYFRNNVEQLGIIIRSSVRYNLNSVFIEDGYLWKQVKQIKEGKETIIHPVTTPDHTYLSPMGKNHNCLDDPDDENSCATKEQMDKNFDRFLGGIAGLDMRNGRAIVIGTPIREGCIVSRLRGASGWDTKVYPAYTEEDGQIKLLWSAMYSYEWLMNKKTEMKDVGKISKFYSEYMCEIVGEEDQLFKPEYWEGRRFTGHVEIENGETYLVINKKNGLETKEEIPIYTYLGVDPASSTKQSADYFIVFPVGMDSKRNIYCLPYFRGRVTPLEGAEKIINKIKEIKPKRGGIETTGYQEMLRQYVKERMMEEDVYCPGFEQTEGYKPKTEKSMRLEQLQPLFAQKKVWIMEEGMQAFIDELLMYPRGKNDDLLDGFYYATRRMYPPDHQIKEAVDPNIFFLPGKREEKLSYMGA